MELSWQIYDLLIADNPHIILYEKETYRVINGELFDSQKNLIVRKNKNKCQFPGCKIRPAFGYESDNIRLFCKKHAASGMQNIMHRCKKKNCLRYAIYGFPGKKRQFCNLHKSPGMRNFVNSFCKFPGCTKSANFGNFISRKMFCATHKLPGMFYNYFPMCSKTNCIYKGIFNIPGSKQFWCKKHSTMEMQRTKGVKCKFIGCNKTPSYGYDKQIYCVNHKLPDMKNLSYEKRKQKLYFGDN